MITMIFVFSDTHIDSIVWLLERLVAVVAPIFPSVTKAPLALQAFINAQRAKYNPKLKKGERLQPSDVRTVRGLASHRLC